MTINMTFRLGFPLSNQEWRWEFVLVRRIPGKICVHGWHLDQISSYENSNFIEKTGAGRALLYQPHGLPETALLFSHVSADRRVSTWSGESDTAACLLALAQETSQPDAPVVLISCSCSFGPDGASPYARLAPVRSSIDNDKNTASLIQKWLCVTQNRPEVIALVLLEEDATLLGSALWRSPIALTPTVFRDLSQSENREPAIVSVAANQLPTLAEALSIDGRYFLTPHSFEAFAGRRFEAETVADERKGGTTADSSDRRWSLPRSFGPYVLDLLLARGGMGEVFLATARGFEARCVVKVIRADLVSTQAIQRRFQREARVAIRSSHRNVVRAFDSGLAKGIPYLAMEYVHGVDLDRLLARIFEAMPAASASRRKHPTSSRTLASSPYADLLPWNLSLFVAREVLHGLEHIHSLADANGAPLSLVHRDISPGNILLGFDGSVRITDFGIARLEKETAEESITDSGSVIGKFAYMSPEQIAGKRVDARSDIYSAGLVLFELVTGEPMFGPRYDAALTRRPPSLSSVLGSSKTIPASLNEIIGRLDEFIGRLVAPKPEDRFSSASAAIQFMDRAFHITTSSGDMAAALRAILPPAQLMIVPSAPTTDLNADGTEIVLIARSYDRIREVFSVSEIPSLWLRGSSD